MVIICIAQYPDKSPITAFTARQHTMSKSPKVRRTASSARGIIAIVGLLSSFAPVATDMYLSGFHQMAQSFQVDAGGIEITLSIFFAGLAIGQAIYGPLIDRFGRRGPLLVGIGLYIVSTLFCLLVPDITLFTGLRFLQAIGGCAGMIIGRAIISDIFDEKDSARAFSTLMLIITLGPICAPVIGGFIVAHAGWKAVFVFMLLFGLVCGALTWLFIPETLPKESRQAEGLQQVIGTWVSLMKSRRFMVPAVAGGFGQACMFAYITGSPNVFITQHGMGEQTYGLMFAAIACALIIAAQINKVMLRWCSAETLLGWSLAANVVFGIAGVGMVMVGSFDGLLICLWLTIGTLGFIGADSAAVAMVASGRKAGSGSALVGVLQFGLAFLASTIVAATQNGTAYPMMGGLAGCGLLAAIGWFGLRDRSTPSA